MTTRLKSLSDWVAEVAELTSPDRIHWCDGTEQEYRKLVDEMLDSGSLLELNQKHFPGLLPAPLAPVEDVARVEHLTFVCTPRQATTPARTTTGWRRPRRTRKMDALFDGCMRGPHACTSSRTAWARSTRRYARCGVEITDSAVRRR